MSLTRSLDGDEHRAALVTGLKQWHGFLRPCLDLLGPPGMRMGWSGPRHTALLAELEESVEGLAADEALGVITSLAIPRLTMTSSHLAATAAVLGDVDALAAGPGVFRAWTEGGARTLWILDPAATARELLERALGDWLEESRQIAKLLLHRREPIPGGLSDAAIWKLAEAAGVQPKPRLAATDLVERYVETTRPPGARGGLAASLYRSGSGVVHSRFSGWALSAFGRTASGGLEIEILRSVVADAPNALHIHAAAFDAWASLWEWDPADRFEDARRAAFERAWSPFVQLDDAVRYASGGE